jgi:hypothetical protein
VTAFSAFRDRPALIAAPVMSPPSKTGAVPNRADSMRICPVFLRADRECWTDYRLVDFPFSPGIRAAGQWTGPPGRARCRAHLRYWHTLRELVKRVCPVLHDGVGDFWAKSSSVPGAAGSAV